MTNFSISSYQNELREFYHILSEKVEKLEKLIVGLPDTLEPISPEHTARLALTKDFINTFGLYGTLAELCLKNEDDKKFSVDNNLSINAIAAQALNHDTRIKKLEDDVEQILNPS